MSKIELICGDCLEVMKKMPDKSVDLVLTDPPYGINCDKGVGGGFVRVESMKMYGILNQIRYILKR